MFIVIKTLFLLVTVTYEVSGYFLSYKGGGECLATILETFKEEVTQFLHECALKNIV